MSIINGAGLNSFRSQFTHGTAYAIAEIIDNSIQWKRPDLDCDINIVLIERGKSGTWKLDEIIISDNGLGMTKNAIETCLNFGGGQNHGVAVNGRLGKFGLGLPYSSCSQCTNYHVFSWEKRDKIYTTFRDHSKYQSNDPVEPEPVETIKNLPAVFENTLIPELINYSSGTIVQWKDCDRLDVAQSKTLINHINLSLGRMYRHFIGKGVHIRFIVYRTSDNKKFERVTDLCNPLVIFDPMFLMHNTILPGIYGKEATNVIWGGDNGTGEHNFDFVEKKIGGEVTHNFKIRYSIAKQEIQDLGGGTELGKYYKKTQGISLVRANRELRQFHFEFPFPNGNADQVHRWWSIEFLFEPISDEILLVNANKTDAGNFRYLDSVDYLELEQNGMVAESIKLRHEISKKIDFAIKAMYKLLKDRQIGKRTKIICPSCKKKTFIDGKCENPECGFTDDKCPIHGTKLVNGKCITCAKTPDLPMCMIHKVPLVNDKCPICPDRLCELNPEEKAQLVKILKSDYPEIRDNNDAIERTINWFVQSNRKHFIIFTDLKSSSIFINPVNFQDKFVIIEVNIKHPFYDQFIREIIDNDQDDQLTPLLLFIASWVESELKDYSNADVLERFRSSFGNNLMDVIANWISE
jgi:hypothetical protein